MSPILYRYHQASDATLSEIDVLAVWTRKVSDAAVTWLEKSCQTTDSPSPTLAACSAYRAFVVARYQAMVRSRSDKVWKSVPQDAELIGTAFLALFANIGDIQQPQQPIPLVAAGRAFFVSVSKLYWRQLNHVVPTPMTVVESEAIAFIEELWEEMVSLQVPVV